MNIVICLNCPSGNPVVPLAALTQSADSVQRSAYNSITSYFFMDYLLQIDKIAKDYLIYTHICIVWIQKMVY